MLIPEGWLVVDLKTNKKQANNWKMPIIEDSFVSKSRLGTTVTSKKYGWLLLTNQQIQAQRHQPLNVFLLLLPNVCMWTNPFSYFSYFNFQMHIYLFIFTEIFWWKIKPQTEF